MGTAGWSAGRLVDRAPSGLATLGARAHETNDLYCRGVFRVGGGACGSVVGGYLAGK